MNVLKSLVDWEKMRRELEKPSKGKQSFKGEEASARNLDEAKIREELPNNFEKAKAHKSTVEAAISEVIDQIQMSHCSRYLQLMLEGKFTVVCYVCEMNTLQVADIFFQLIWDVFFSC